MSGIKLSKAEMQIPAFVCHPRDGSVHVMASSSAYLTQQFFAAILEPSGSNYTIAFAGKVLELGVVR
jgi:hypothetical protein